MNVEFSTVPLPAPPTPPPAQAQWVSECQVCFALLLPHQTEKHRAFHEKSEALHQETREAYERAVATGELVDFARSLVERIDAEKAVAP